MVTTQAVAKPARIEYFKEIPKRAKLPKIPFGLPSFPPSTARKRILQFAQGFIPLTRRAGRVIPLTGFPVSKEAARAIAVKSVLGTPRASYKLQPVAGRPRKVGFPRVPKGAFSMFRPAKTPALKGFMVEKTKFRIDQPGEYAGITAKGLKALAQGFYGKRKRRKRK